MMDMAEDMIDRGYEVILMNPNGIMWYDNAPHVSLARSVRSRKIIRLNSRLIRICRP